MSLNNIELPNADEVRLTFRLIDSAKYNALSNLSKDEIYDDGEMMAPGGLLLAELMAETLSLKVGQTVLDLGCGRGQTSAFLAARYGVNVVSVDLWIGKVRKE